MAVAAVQQGHLYWQKSTYEANSAVQGGALWLQDILKIALLNECTMLQGSAMQYGGSMYANNSLFRARFSQFTTSTAAQGGAIWCGGQSDITLDSCQVFENGAFQSGGGLHVEGHAVLTAVQSEFDSNYVRPEAGGAVDSRNAAQQGGAVAIFTSGRGNSGVGDPPASSFRDCNFTNNFAKQGGAMLVSARADLFRCHFSKNYASVGGSLKVAMATNLLATNCTFRRGIAEIRGGGVAVESSKAEFKECFFLDNRAADLLPGTDGGGGGMHVSGSVAPLSVKLQQCVFSGNRAQYGGGALFGRDSSVRIDSSQFLANVAEAMGGAVRLGALPSRQGREGGAHAEFSYVDFIGHAADKGAGAMDIRQSKAKLDNCNFVDNMARGTQGGQDQWGGAVRILDRQSEVDFNACTFTNNTATYGGAVYAGIGAGILLSSCEFRSNSARSGGAVRVESSAEVMVNACKFVKQLAAEGGAISALGPPSRLIGATTAWVRSSEFSDNEAESSGGAIFAVGSDIFLKSNIFLHNRVKGLNGQGGGAFSLTSVEFSGEVVPGQMTFEDDQFSGHQAHTGGTGTVVGSSTVSFVQTTIRNSSALGDGGALFGSGEDVQLNFIHGVLEQAWAGALGGCVALENGGSLFAQGTKFRHCTAGFASRPVSSERGRGTGNAWQPFSDERADNFLRSRQSRQEISMGGGVSLTGNSTAFFDKQVELSDNFAYGWGGGIGASKSQVFARQTIFERNIATGKTCCACVVLCL
jgi:predicted outer membrane repeat protein